MTPIAIDKVLTDTRLLGAELAPINTWSIWIVALKAAFALPLSDAEHNVFTAIAGDRTPPLKRVRELWCTIGRRGGKSRMAAALAIYFALFVRHKLAAGEKGMVLVLAMTVDQAMVVYNYVLGFMHASEALAKEIESTTKSEIRLKNGITIAVHPNSFRSIRGRTLCACIFDETAFWRDISTATPDTEVYSAVLPALLTTKGMLVGISSPYRRVGLLHAKYKKYFGIDDADTLVVQGSSKQFNATLDDAAIAAQQEADPTAARSEWLAEFRDDIAGFLDDNLIEQAIDRDRPLELPPRTDCNYKAYVDASGGAVGGDAYAIAIGHKEGELCVIDVLRGRAGPFDPETLTQEYAALCKEYRCAAGVVGDKYAREWTASAWRKCELPYTPAALTASETYLEALPLWTRGAVRVPDHPTLVRELRLLERMPTRMGRDQVTHPRGVHDDYANVCFGVLHSLAGTGKYRYPSGPNGMDWVCGPPPTDPAAEAIEFQQQRFAQHVQEMVMGKTDAYLDDDEIPDGYSVKVPLALMDAMQRRVAFDAENHRPHYARLSDAEQRQRQASRSKYLKDLTTAWSRPVEFKAALNSRAALDPVRRPQLDAASAKALKDAAYNAMVRRLGSAWRDQDRPEPDDEPDEDDLMQRHLRTEPDDDAQARRNAAWAQYRDRLSNAWKTDPRTASAIERQGEQWRGGR